MKKVVYAVTRVGKNGNTKMSGFGWITESDIIATYKGRDGNRHKRVYEDCIRNCRPTGKPNEYKGTYYEIKEIEFQTTNSVGQCTGYDTREIEINYYIWFKVID